MTPTLEISATTEPPIRLPLRVHEIARILIVSEDEWETEQLKAVLGDAGLASESTASLASACESVRSGRFQVVFSAPHVGDGVWEHLIEIANRFGLGFEVILLARTFDLSQWAEALQVGAFDVLDVLCDLPKAAEAAKRAMGTAYLKRFRPHFEPV